MPASYTHYRFGCDVLPLLPQALQNRITPHRRLFDIGLHGPDVFFFTNPPISNPVNRTGRRMHRQSGRTVLRRFAALDDGSDAAFAYLAGFLCHFALDSTCHGYVEQMTAQGISHPRLETQLDRSFLAADGKDPVAADPAAHIDPSLPHARTMARFYPQFSLQTLQKALRNMIFWLRFLTARNHPKRTLLRTVFRIMDAEDSFGAMVMTRTDDPACKQMVQQLRQLYADALPLAAELIAVWPRLDHPQYQFDFDGGFHETDQT